MKTVKSIRPGCKPGDPVVTDIKELKYDPNGLIYYKLDHLGQWLKIPRNYSPSFMVPDSLYTSPLKIKEQKYQHLQSLKAVIPIEYHAFYDNLPRE